MKHCNGCDRTLPLEQFKFKNRATGLRQARCVQCVAEASRRHYEANAERIKAKVAQRNTRVRAENAALVDAARSQARCADCGVADKERPVQFTSPEGARRVVDAARGALSADAVRRALDAAVPLCHRCVAARRFTDARADADALGGGPTPEMLVADAVTAAVLVADSPVRHSDVMATLAASGRTDGAQVVRNTLSVLARRGRVRRAHRGLYTAP